MSNKQFDNSVVLSPTPVTNGPSQTVLNTTVNNGATAGPYKLTFQVSPTFVPSSSSIAVTGSGGSVFNPTLEEAYLFNVGNGSFSKTLDTAVNQKWKLVYVKSHTDAVWEDNSGQCQDISSPLALDLPGIGYIATTGVSTAVDARRPHVGRTIKFEMRDGPAQIEWLTGNGQGFLVDNRDGHAATNMSAARLFGPTDTTSNGFETLAAFDTSGTGVLSGHDLQGLEVWIDNGDGVVQPGELFSLRALGISQISTRWTPVKDAVGDMKMQGYAVRYGKHILVEDIWLATKVDQLSSAK